MNKGVINELYQINLSVPVLSGLIAFDNSDLGLYQFETKAEYIWNHTQKIFHCECFSFFFEHFLVHFQKALMPCLRDGEPSLCTETTIIHGKADYRTQDSEMTNLTIRRGSSWAQLCLTNFLLVNKKDAKQSFMRPLCSLLQNMSLGLGLQWCNREQHKLLPGIKTPNLKMRCWETSFI